MKTGDEILAKLMSKDVLGTDVPDTFERDSCGRIRFKHHGWNLRIWSTKLNSKVEFHIMQKHGEELWSIFRDEGEGKDLHSYEFTPKFSTFRAARDYVEMIGKAMCRRDDKKMEEKIAKQAEYYNRLWEVEAESLREWKAKYENGAKRDRTIGYIMLAVYLFIIALIFIFWWLV